MSRVLSNKSVFLQLNFSMHMHFKKYNAVKKKRRVHSHDVRNNILTFKIIFGIYTRCQQIDF